MVIYAWRCEDPSQHIVASVIGAREDLIGSNQRHLAVGSTSENLIVDKQDWVRYLLLDARVKTLGKSGDKMVE